MSEAIASARIRDRWGLVVGLYLVDLLSGALIAWPIAALARTTYQAFPGGDRALFEPSSMALLDFFGRALPKAGPALLGHLVAVLPLLLVIRVIAWGSTMGALLDDRSDTYGERIRRSIAIGVRRLLPLAALTIVTFIAQGLTLGLASFVADFFGNTFSEKWGAPAADRTGWILAGLLVLIAVSCGAIRDVLGTRVVAKDETAWQSTKRGFPEFFRTRSYALAYAWRELVGLVAIALAMPIASSLGGRPGFALVALFITHQIVRVLRIALRVSWLESALPRPS